MFCADNGFDYDGPLNCCAYEGGYCYSDEGCCGIASCITGVASARRQMPVPLTLG
jgi:hypothetical protein